MQSVCLQASETSLAYHDLLYRVMIDLLHSYMTSKCPAVKRNILYFHFC